MASWADEFDIDDSDILGALHNKRKCISQLASPPWPPAAAPLSSSPSLPPRTLDPPPSIAASASFLKRFEKPRPSLDGPSLSQNAGNCTLDPSRKRKQGFDPTPLPLKAAYRQNPSLDDAIGSARRENPSQLDADICTESHTQDDEAFVSAAEEHCHSLSSHGFSTTPVRSGNPNRYLRNVESHNMIRDEEMVSSLVPLREKQQNLHLGHGKASFMPPTARQTFKQNPAIHMVQKRRISFAQTQEKGCSTRSNRITSATQQENDPVDMMDCTQPTVAGRPLGVHAPSLQQRPVLDAPLDVGPRENSVRIESRGLRSLERDLQYQIPGPAGTVQRGLGQKTNSSCENTRVRNNNSATRPASLLDDADFQSGAWLKAKNYLEKCSISVSTISSIKTSRTENRIPKLLAVIKACTPNGCGDVMVNLKDHSDFINGTVNRRVMSETEFGRLIEPGAVILLHQVAVFSPTPYTHYLNITINNVEQVYAKGVKFFKGECSHAATKEVCREMTENKQLNDQPSHSKVRMADICAQEAPGRRAVYELLEEDDELEILLASSGHLRTTQA